MAKWLSHLTTKKAHLGLLKLCLLTGGGACRHAGPESQLTAQEILHGTIAYPFIRTDPLGVNGRKEKFVIRSISGATEYVVEIPGAGDEFNVEIPMAALDSATNGGRPQGIASPAKTDREVVQHLPDISQEDPSQTAFLDKAFGVGRSGGPKQSPSYMLGIAKITDHYKKRQFEYALIEINNLLSFYPNSPQLHKMKGTVYVKLQNYPLAEKSWLKALELTPYDRVLRTGLLRLQEKIKVISPSLQEAPSIPRPVSPGLQAQEPENLLRQDPQEANEPDDKLPASL